jgi:cell division protein FtsB
MNPRKTICRVFWLVSAVLALAASAMVFVPKWREYRNYQRKLAEMEEDVRRENDRLNLLRRNQERFRTDPHFVERMAHDHGLARPDEVLFKIPPDEDDKQP